MLSMLGFVRFFHRIAIYDGRTLAVDEWSEVIFFRSLKATNFCLFNPHLTFFRHAISTKRNEIATFCKSNRKSVEWYHFQWPWMNLTAETASGFTICSSPVISESKVKVKFSHTRYRALGPELIPVYRKYSTDIRQIFRIGKLMGADGRCGIELRSLKGHCHGKQFLCIQPRRARPS